MPLYNKVMIPKTFCVAPWIHLYIDTNGDVYTCCISKSSQYIAGNVHEDSIDAIWNSSLIRSIRVQLLEGKVPDTCKACFEKEQYNSQSMRLYLNELYYKKILYAPYITSMNGTTPLDLKYWDFRDGNRCNFKCRTCSPTYSSSWEKENDASHYSIKLAGLGANITNMLIESHLTNADRIYFAGGEPLLSDFHWVVMRNLIEMNKTDISISYSTNLSVLHYRGEDILDYWRFFPNEAIEVWVSVDEIAERAEIIRSGTEWELVEKNLKTVQQIASVKLKPTITVSCLNVFRLQKIIQYLIDIDVICEKYMFQNFSINMVSELEPYSIRVLPKTYRMKIAEEIKLFSQSIKKDYNADLKSALKEALAVLELPELSEEEFIAHSKLLDIRRKENIAATIPELQIFPLLRTSI